MVTKAENPKKKIAEIKRIIDARYRIARTIYDNQDGVTKEFIDRLVDRLRIASTGVVSINGKPYKLELQYQDFNLLFIACDILSDLALNNIQVANFDFNPAFCAECKREIMGVPMVKGRKVGRRK